MEINLNKEDITEASEFVNFSIREYVAEIRKKDKKKCWPFGSLGDPEKDEDFVSYQPAESTFLSCKKCPGDIDGSDDKPEYTEAPNSSKVEMLNGKEDQSETTSDMMIASLGFNDKLGKGVCNGSSESASNKVNTAECQHENSVDEVAKSGSCGDADNYEPGRNRPQKKPQKFHLLSDILRDLAGPSRKPRVHCDRNNVNSRFATQTEDEMDDITLDAVFRKRKGVEDSPILKKKRRTIRVEEPRRVQNKKSKNRSKDSHVEVNGRFATQTEEELDDNVTLDVIFRKRKGVEVTPALKKRRTLRVEEPRPVQDTKSKHGSKDSHGDDSHVGPRNHLRKTRIDDLDTQTKVKGKNHVEKVVETQKDFLSPYCQKSNINAKVSSMEATETANNDSEMEAVMLLARHFNEQQPSTDDQIPVEIETGTRCACVQKKLREQLNESISKPATNDPIFYGDKSKKSPKEEVENAFCSVLMNDQLKVAECRSSIPPKRATASDCQARIEICLTKAAGPVQNNSTLLCSVNRNPADFSIPNAANKFMRGG